MKFRTLILSGASVLAFGMVSRAEIEIVADHNSNESATPSFKFKNVPSPVRSDAAALVKFTIVDGEKDFQRPVYPIEKIDLGKWFASKDIERAKAQMRGWVESLARTGR